MPKTVEEEIILYKANNNTLWSDAILKDMTNLKVTFKIIDDDEYFPRNHQFVKCQMILDVKIENFRRKARLVAGGPMTKASVAVTYAIVVSCETVCIAIAIAVLNDLQV